MERKVARGRPGRPEIEKDEAAPDVDSHGVEREVLLAQRRVLVEKRRAEKPSVEAVRPGVVRATDRRRDRVRGAQACAAVTADVVVRAQPSLPGPRDENALPGQLEHAQGARFRQDVGSSRADPLAAENALALPGEDLRGPVVLARQRLLESHRGLTLLRFPPRCLASKPGPSPCRAPASTRRSPAALSSFETGPSLRSAPVPTRRSPAALSSFETGPSLRSAPVPTRRSPAALSFLEVGPSLRSAPASTRRSPAAQSFFEVGPSLRSAPASTRRSPAASCL